MMAKLGEGDAARIAADRTAFTAEQLGDALAVAAATFRMPHVFLSLGETAQALAGRRIRYQRPRRPRIG